MTEEKNWRRDAVQIQQTYNPNYQGNALQAPVRLPDPQQMAIYAEQFQKAKIACLKSTTARDWTSIGGQPYLGKSGAAKVGTMMGVSLYFDTPTKVWEEDDTGYSYFTYSVSVRSVMQHFATGRDVIVMEEGTASSKDDFFSVAWRPVLDAAGNPKKDNNGRVINEKYRRPASDINDDDVRKKAITNGYGRAIKTILGLDGLTWESLEEFGITKEGVAGVSFDQGKGQTAETADGKREIQLILFAAADKDPEKYRALLKEVTYWEKDGEVRSPGVETLEELPDWRVKTIINMAKGKYKQITGQEWAGAKSADANGEVSV